MHLTVLHLESVALAAPWWCLPQAVAHQGSVVLAAISPVLVAVWGEPTWAAAAFPEPVA